MVVAVADAELNGLLDAGDRWLDALAACGVRLADGADAGVMVGRLEGLATRLHAVQVGVVDLIDQRGLFAEDGHRGAKGLVVAASGVSGAVAARRVQVARTLRWLPAVAAGLAAGRIGVGQVELIARVFANPRVRAELIAVEADLATVAELMAFAEFERWLRDWERLADADGAGVRSERGHANRDFRIVVLPDGNVRIDGGCGGVQGTIVREVFDVYVQAEWDADWAEARARLGDAATYDDLARTDRQRRMDAVSAVFADAIAHRNQCGRDGKPGHQLVIDLVLDAVTAEATVARLAGVDPGADPRLASWWSDLAASLTDDTAGDEQPVRPVGFRSETLDGHPLDPREVIVAAMNHHIRRVVIGADGVVVDMGRRSRLFTGARQTAVRISAHSCVWPGCPVPVTHCESDHLIEFNGPKRGPTNPINADPLCGHHNRLKTTEGYTITRDRWGRYHLHRPDGTPMS